MRHSHDAGIGVLISITDNIRTPRIGTLLMNTYLECLPFFSQALRAARITTDDEIKIRKTLNEIGMMITWQDPIYKELE
jgi:hypothetical protein